MKIKKLFILSRMSIKSLFINNCKAENHQYISESLEREADEHEEQYARYDYR